MYRALHQQGLSHPSRGQLNGDIDVQGDEVLYGQSGSVPKRNKAHTKESLFKEMEETIKYLEVDGLVAKREADKLLGQMRVTVGNLGDLRYGKFATISSADDYVEMEVVKGLKDLEEAANRSSGQQ